MTDGVARELEQAEARLVEAATEVVRVSTPEHFETNRSVSALRRLLAAAIEVGRLRAIAEVEPLVGAASNALRLIAQGSYANGVTDPTGSIDEGEARAWSIYTALRAALAAREEVQG